MKPDELELDARYVVTGYGEPVELHRVWPRRVIDPEVIGGLRLLGYDIAGFTRGGQSVSAKAGNVTERVPPRACPFCARMIDPDLAECPACHAAVAPDVAVVGALAEAERLSRGGTWLSEVAKSLSGALGEGQAEESE